MLGASIVVPICRVMNDNRVDAFNAFDFHHEGYNGEHTVQWSAARLVSDCSAVKEHRYYITADDLHLDLGPLSPA